MRNTYVLDSSVLLHDPDSIMKFPEEEVVIPIAVIEEIDEMKRREDEIGRNARRVSRLLDNLRPKGRLSAGVELDNKGKLRVELNHQNTDSLPYFFERTKPDNRILAVSMALSEERLSSTVYLVTKDINMRVKADALGVKSCDLPDGQKRSMDEVYSGTLEISVTPDIINQFYSDSHLEADVVVPLAPELYPNQFVHLTDSLGGGKSALCRYHAKSHRLLPLISGEGGLCSIKPKNKEQRYAIDLLTDDSVRFVTLVGRAGTGKTLLAVAAAMHKVLDDSVYRKAVVSRPVFPMGKDIGYLPGEKNDKLLPWMQPIFDNLEYVFSNRDKRESIINMVEHIQDLGFLELEALTYIRGRSLRDQFIVVDEAQNLSPHEILTIITRVGEGSKLVLTGDPYQIDNPYLDSTSNGLIHAVECFKNEPIAGHVTLTKGERSELAEIAARVL